MKVKPRLNDFSGLGIYEHNELDDVNLVKIEGRGHDIPDHRDPDTDFNIISFF